jgi:hypothetical protein
MWRKVCSGDDPRKLTASIRHRRPGAGLQWQHSISLIGAHFSHWGLIFTFFNAPCSVSSVSEEEEERALLLLRQNLGLLRRVLNFAFQT